MEWIREKIYGTRTDDKPLPADETDPAAEAAGGDRVVRNLLIGTGVLTVVVAGNVVGFRRSRQAPGKDSFRAYSLIHKNKVLRGGRYLDKPPWLVRKYGAENVTDEMIEKDVKDSFLRRRELREKLDLENWKSMRLQRLKAKEQRLSPQELEESAEKFQKSRREAMFRDGLMSNAEREEAYRLFHSAEAAERYDWELNRAAYFSPIYGPPRINLTGEAPDHHFAEHEAQKHSAIKVEMEFENLGKVLEDLLSREKQDYYSVLGVPADADIEQVKKAYREELMRWHPDTYEGDNPEEAAKMFRLVCNAYQMLSDKEARERYDTGRQGEAAA